MNSNKIHPDSGAAPNSSALCLLRIPFSFTQDKLFNTQEFIDEAERRGHKLTLDSLQALYVHEILVPLFRVDDESIESRCISVSSNEGQNSRGQAFLAAKSGRLVDSASEIFSSKWPFSKPVDESQPHWWNGFLYSSWQLLDLNAALRLEKEFALFGKLRGTEAAWSRKCRDRTIALSALSSHFLPEILGTTTLSMGSDYESLWTFTQEVTIEELLLVSGFEKASLKVEAESLLFDARFRDPMKDWWPIFRHCNGAGWAKTQGITRDCIWQRVGAEILLRAHEDLAANQLIEALPDLDGVRSREALHDRVTPRETNTNPLEYELAANGLNLFPRVLLLLEGVTETIHISALLDEFGLHRSDRVRIQNCRSAEINPHLISRYAITPRLGPKYGDIQTVATPTALVIAMDPEGRWSTEQKRGAERANLQKAIKEDVEWQFQEISGEREGQGDQTIRQEDLDFLVTIFVWGEDKYELANFTDVELLGALTALAGEQLIPNVGSPMWDANVLSALEIARAKHLDVGKVFEKLGLVETKKRFAELLLPSVKRKLASELESRNLATPVIVLIQKVRELCALLTGGNYALRD